MASSSKPAANRRRDAQENRARIIEAAREVFASSGFEAPLGEIASRAGVGRATFYRNFPDRFALAAAIFEDNLVELETLANAHRGQPDGFLLLLAAMVEQLTEAHALFRMLLTGAGAPDLDDLARRTKNLLRAPLRAATDTGVVRADLTLGDVLASLTMISAVVAAGGPTASRQQRAKRALDLLLHGILPGSPPQAAKPRRG